MVLSVQRQLPFSQLHRENNFFVKFLIKNVFIRTIRKDKNLLNRKKTFAYSNKHVLLISTNKLEYIFVMDNCPSTLNNDSKTISSSTEFATEV